MCVCREGLEEVYLISWGGVKASEINETVWNMEIPEMFEKEYKTVKVTGSGMQGGVRDLLWYCAVVVVVCEQHAWYESRWWMLEKSMRVLSKDVTVASTEMGRVTKEKLITREHRGYLCKFDLGLLASYKSNSIRHQDSLSKPASENKTVF